MNKPPGIPGEVRCGFFQEFVLHAEFAKFALGLGQLDPLMRGERGLIAGVVAAVLVHPVAECSLVHAEFRATWAIGRDPSITNRTASSRNSGLNLRYFLAIPCITFRARSYWITVREQRGTSQAHP